MNLHEAAATGTREEDHKKVIHFVLSSSVYSDKARPIHNSILPRVVVHVIHPGRGGLGFE